MISSAIVPVAGYGTRLLPATKSQPKEMLTVARKPIVQYVAEELVANGLSQILFITSRAKASIEELRAKFFYTRQRVQKGLWWNCLSPSTQAV